MEKDTTYIHIKRKWSSTTTKGQALSTPGVWTVPVEAAGVPQSPPSCHLTGLGISRYATPSASSNLIHDRITSARCTACGMMGDGFYGIGVVNNPCNKRVVDLYIIPWLLYALESLVITTKQKELLDAFLRSLLKCNSGSPPKGSKRSTLPPHELTHSRRHARHTHTHLLQKDS